MAVFLSSEHKQLLIKRYLSGESISVLCREANISRTIFYRWIYLYKESKEYNFRSLYRSHLARGIKHYRKISRSIDTKIINARNDDLTLSLRTLAKRYRVSHTYVWFLLKKHPPGPIHDSRFRRMTLADKILIVRRAESGEKVSHLCREFRVSRTIFYRWSKKYKDSLFSSRDASFFHKPRTSGKILSEIEALILSIVANLPLLSIRKIRQELIKKQGNKVVSRHVIYLVLKKTNLNSKQKRINYSKIFMPTVISSL